MKRALIVGINDYGGGDNDLLGCINDANKMNDLIRVHENKDANFDTILLTSNEQNIDKVLLREKLDELFDEPADMAFFYFSGHGTMTSTGGAICPSDAKKYDAGISMSDILTLANQSKVKEVIVILDCCHSGSMGRVPPLVNGNQVTLREGVSILSASRESESSIEIGGEGLFTSLVCDALAGGAADIQGTVTPASVYYHVEKNFGAWDQRPLFKSYISRSTTLRNTSPRVKKEDLRSLCDIFPTIDHEFYMDKTYEETEKVAIEGNVITFKTLKRLQTGGLIEIPHAKPDLYWVAIEERYCKLSHLGRYYFNLVINNKI
ncbi:MAG: caspase family protein [Bdellovibrionaceae bacterium]|jgi:hypothetical protein|nr:caspase family protein [Pseudobdellovibrionaceae bacterium]